MEIKRIAIIDDEIDAREIIKSFLDRFSDFKYSIVEASNVEKGIKLILTQKPDIVFLDIQMEDGTGFDLLNRLNNKNFKLIITTGYDEYAIKAFKYSAIDYLLKPIDPDDFKLALAKLTDVTAIEELQMRLQHLEHIVNENSFTKLALPSEQGTSYIQIDDITHMQSDGNYTTIFAQNGSKYIVSKLIKEFENLLPDKLFIRIHKSHIINMNFISAVIHSESLVKLTDGALVPIARRRKHDLLDALK
jgi:two-component system LytT family response regulator